MKFTTNTITFIVFLTTMTLQCHQSHAFTSIHPKYNTLTNPSSTKFVVPPLYKSKHSYKTSTLLQVASIDTNMTPSNNIDQNIVVDKQLDKIQTNIIPSSTDDDSTIKSQQQQEQNITTNKLIQRIQRRLDTAEDKFDLHKISTFAFMISSTCIFGTGFMNGFAQIPDTLLIPTWTFLISCFVQGITSIQMSSKYRKGDHFVQRGFINIAWLMLFFGWAGMYMSPFAPNAFDNIVIGNGMLCLLSLPTAYFGLEEMMEIQDLVQDRQIRKNEKGGDLGYIADILSYGSNPFIGFVLTMIGIVLLVDPAHDRQWLLTNDQLPNGDLFVPYSYYANVVSSMAVGYGAFAVTLRDRKMISKSTEQVVLGVGGLLTLGAYLKNFGIL